MKRTKASFILLMFFAGAILALLKTITALQSAFQPHEMLSHAPGKMFRHPGNPLNMANKLLAILDPEVLHELRNKDTDITTRSHVAIADIYLKREQIGFLTLRIDGYLLVHYSCTWQPLVFEDVGERLYKLYLRAEPLNPERNLERLSIILKYHSDEVVINALRDPSFNAADKLPVAKVHFFSNNWDQAFSKNDMGFPVSEVPNREKLVWVGIIGLGDYPTEVRSITFSHQPLYWYVRFLGDKKWFACAAWASVRRVEPELLIEVNSRIKQIPLTKESVHHRHFKKMIWWCPDKGVVLTGSNSDAAFGSQQ